MASRTPGDLGVYGFRNRADHSYDNLVVADGSAIHAPRLWDLATRYGKPSIVVGVPGTYPPRPLNGVMVSCFLTPSRESGFTYPPLLAREVEQVVGEYLFDCTNFRTDDKDDLLRQVYEMTDKRFRLAEHLLETKPWELFAMVEIGLDRMHHGFWKDLDELHHRHEPGRPVRRRDPRLPAAPRRADRAAARARRRRDDRAGRLRPRRQADGGRDPRQRVAAAARACCRPRASRTASPRCATIGVDWSRTTAWGEGGYYGRIFLNVRGREPEGTVAPEDFERVRDELAERLAAIPGPDGKPLATRVYKPEEVYEEVNGVAPDLLVYFDDLAWRAVGTIGGEDGVHTFENDTGPDDANHAQDGLLIMAGPGIEPGQAESMMSLLDVAPTVLELLGLEPLPSMRGTSLLRSEELSRPR